MNPPSEPVSAPAAASPVRRYLPWLIVAWVCCLVALDARSPHPASLPGTVEMELDASVPADAQLFYDTGQGFNAAESAMLPVRAAPGQTLSFPLPARPVRALRFDPLTTTGAVRLHAIRARRGDGQEFRPLDLGGIRPLHEIERLAPAEGGALDIVTTPTSTDSQVAVPVGAPPLDTRVGLYDQFVRWIGLDASITVLALLALGLGRWLGLRLGHRLAAPVRWLDARFAAWAARLSRPEVARIDRWALWFYAACALGFGALAAAGLHGSSVGVYSTIYPWGDPQSHPLLGQARGIRSDEWGQHTPAFLNQEFRRDRLAAKTTCYGNRRTALLISIPCRDATQAMRPQYWAFHFLPLGAAYAIYWQAKGFVLLTGVFSLLLLLTGGRSGLSALGALWLAFSAHLQWAWSWPSMLPETVGFFGWTVCLTLYLAVGRSPRLLACAAAGCAVGAVNFALSVYPPHQIPLALFGFAVTLSWVCAHRALVFRREHARPRLLALGVGWGVVALVMAVFFFEAKTAILAAAATVYPGQRVSNGGGIPVQELLSHFLDCWKAEKFFPPAQGNVCEGTGFLWLLPATLFMFGPGRLAAAPARVRWLLYACWAVFAWTAAWMIFPIPAAVGRLVFFNHVPGMRCLPALGLVNVVGVVLYLCLPSSPPSPSPACAVSSADDAPATRPWPRYVAIGLFCLVLLGLANAVYQHYFPAWQVVLTACYTAGLVILLLERQRAVFAGVLLLPLVYSNALINPVDRGFRSVTDSRFYRYVRSEPRLREGRWLVYSRDFTPTGFVVSCGLDVFNSFKVLPDLRAMSVFDPAGTSQRAYNQSGHIVARPLPEGAPCRFENPDIALLHWWVSPLDPGLRQLGVRFFVFDEKPDPALVARLRPLPVQMPGMWLYELP